MTFTVIYKDASGTMDTFTFVASRHCKNYAWGEFTEKYAEKGQSPVAIMPGNQIVFFPQHISFT